MVDGPVPYTPPQENQDSWRTAPTVQSVVDKGASTPAPTPIQTNTRHNDSWSMPSPTPKNLPREDVAAMSSGEYDNTASPDIEISPSGSIIKTTPEGNTTFSTGNKIITVNKDGSSTVQLLDNTGKVLSSTQATPEQTATKIKSEIAKGVPDQSLFSKILSTILPAAGTIALGPLGAAGGATAGAIINKFASLSPEEKTAAVNAIYEKLLEKHGGDQAKVMAELSGLYQQANTESGGKLAQTIQESRKSPEGQTTATAQSVPQKTPEEIQAAAKQAEMEAIAKAERERISKLMEGQTAQNKSLVTQVDPSQFSQPQLQEMARQANTLQVLAAQGDVKAQEALKQLQGLTSMTGMNRDAWKAYYNPEQYRAEAERATATQAQAAQAQWSPMGPAAQVTGQYQADMSQMKGYDPTIATSDQRANAVAMQKLAQDRAMGLKPSVAEESYLSNLDKLIASQAGAARSVRGQDQALALRQTQGAAQAAGQQAVRETAILRMQEQQAAEQAAAAQAQAIMIEDQKKASQEKTNELQRNIQILGADLQNKRNLLERDIFNAGAINAVMIADTQLKNETAKLNAQMQTNTALANMEQENNIRLQNAELATLVRRENAARALDAGKWAGGMAQSALEKQIGLERDDWRNAYTVGQDALKRQTDIASGLATLFGQGGAQAETTLIQRIQADTNLKRLYDEIKARGEAATAAQQAQLAQALGVTIPALLAVIKQESSTASW